MTLDSFTFDSEVTTDVTAAPGGGSQPISLKKKTMKWSALVPKIIFGVVLVGVIAGLITVSVLLAEKTSDAKTLQERVDQLTASVAPPTVGPGGGGGSSDGDTVGPGGATATPTTPAAPPPIYRLPETVIPLSYDLFLKIHVPYGEAEEADTDNNFITNGSHVSITLKAKEANVTVIRLHARSKKSTPGNGYIHQFTEENVSLVRKQGDTAVPGVRKIEFQEVDIVNVQLDASLEKDTEYVLKIDFNGVIADDNEGLYRSSFFLKDGITKRWLITSQFQPFKARRAFPCFDEPGFRSEFTITLQYPKPFTMTRTNGDYNGPSIMDPTGKWTTQKYTRTPKMPVYLIAFLVSDFDLTSKNAIEDAALGGKTYPVNVIGSKDLVVTAGDGDFAAEQGVKMIEILTKNFSQSYGELLPKIDMAGVPDFNAGAMENWGLILYRESRLMYRLKASTAADKENTAAIVGHELAHMIFGNLLTCRWWSDTWLNEGFARFFQYELMYQTKPSWGLEPLFPYWVTRTALQQDSYLTSHALFSEVNTLPEINNMFDTVTYAKGASILQMIKGVLGWDALLAVLKDYVATNRLGNVMHEDLLKELDMSTGGRINFTQHMAGWIEIKGYPILTLSRHNGMNNITYRQERFLLPVGNGSANGTSPADDIAKSWHIPLTLTNGLSSGPKTHFTARQGCWLTESEGDLQTTCNDTTLNYPTREGDNILSSNYIVANIQQYGFYRVNYDRRNWERIITALPIELNDKNSKLLKDDVIRGQLIDDAFNLARAGTFGVEYDIPLGLVHAIYLPNNLEDSYGPLASTMDNLRYIDQMLRGTSNYQAMGVYMRKLMAALYKKGHWRSSWSDTPTTLDPEDVDPEATYINVMFNNLVVDTACYYGVGTCLQDAVEEFDKLTDFQAATTATDVSTVQSKHLIMCYGVRGQTDGNTTNWDRLASLYNQTGLTNSNKLTILRGLACAGQSHLIQRVLEMAADPKIVRPQDTATVLGYVSRFGSGEDAVWDFVQSKWSGLSRRSNILADVASRFKTQLRLQQLRQLYNNLSQFGQNEISEKPAFTQADEKIQTNIRWMSQNAKNVDSLFATLKDKV